MVWGLGDILGGGWGLGVIVWNGGEVMLNKGYINDPVGMLSL